MAFLPQRAQSPSLTADNLKHLGFVPRNRAPSSASSSIADDNESVFSAALSSSSSTSTAPEDEVAPYQVTDQYGAPVNVFQSLDQAVRHSLLQVAQLRQQELEVSHQPVELAAEDEDEDEYFSMG